MERPEETSEWPAWRSQLRRQARAFALAGLVVPPVAIFLLLTGGPADMLEQIAILGFVCGATALPLGLKARPRQRFAIAVGTVDGIFVLYMLQVVFLFLPGLAPRNRRAFNESSAVSSLRTINTAQGTYRASAGRYGTLEELVAEWLVDPRYLPNAPATGGYKFAVTAGVSSYTATAEPVTSNSGRFNYFTWQDAVVRYGTKAPRARRFRWLPWWSVDQIGQPVQ